MRKPHLGWMILLLVPSCVLAQSNPPPAAAAQLLKEASSLQNAGKFSEAAAKWQKFLKVHPGDAAVGLAYQGLGVCLLETGDWPASIDALNQALKRLTKGESPGIIRWNLAIAQYRRAEKSKMPEHRREVAGALKEVLADKETSQDRRALAGFYLARTQRALGDAAAAKQQFEQLLKEPRDEALAPPVLMALAELAEEAKDWPRARDLYRDFLRDFAKHSSADDARLALADVLLQNGDRKEAETLFGELAAQKGLTAADFAHFRWAELAQLRGETKIAAERWLAFLDKHPKSDLHDRALRRTGEAVATAIAAGDSKQALEWTDHLVKEFATSPWTSQAQLHAARHLTDRGQFEAALERSRWILDANVADAQPGALYLAGFCAMKLRKFEDAVKYYQALRDQHPKADHAPIAAFSLGVAFESQGALGKAVAAYEEYLKRYPEHALAGQAKQKVKDLKEKR